MNIKNNNLHAQARQDISACALSLSYRPTAYSWVEVSRTAFEKNIATYKSIIGNNTRFGLVIKGNGYGHGLREIAYLAHHNNAVSYFCVAHLAEAIELRTYGITKPILVMSKTYTDFEYAAELAIDLMVDDNDILEKINIAAQKVKKKITIHIKIDTGLSRFGCFPDYVAPLINKAQSLKNITLSGVYSHFAESYNANSPLTIKQKKLFFAVLEKYASFFTLRHIANSAGVMIAQHPLINMVRIGAGAYGLISPETKKMFPFLSAIAPIIQWKTRIVEIKKVPEHTRVGYDGTFTTEKETVLATLPVGYYDGYKKELSNKGHVMVHNFPAPIRGLIGMNHITIDVTAIPHATLGTEVLLIGNNTIIAPTTLAVQAECFNPRQITTNINPLLKRIIVE